MLDPPRHFGDNNWDLAPEDPGAVLIPPDDQVNGSGLFVGDILLLKEGPIPNVPRVIEYLRDNTGKFPSIHSLGKDRELTHSLRITALRSRSPVAVEATLFGYGVTGIPIYTSRSRGGILSNIYTNFTGEIIRQGLYERFPELPSWVFGNRPVNTQIITAYQHELRMRGPSSGFHPHYKRMRNYHESTRQP